MLRIIKSIKENFHPISHPQKELKEREAIDALSMKILNSPEMTAQKQKMLEIKKNITLLNENQKSLSCEVEKIVAFVNKKLDKQALSEGDQSISHKSEIIDLSEKITSLRTKTNQLDAELTQLELEHQEIEVILSKEFRDQPLPVTESQANFFWSENDPETRAICRQMEIKERIAKINSEKFIMKENVATLTQQLQNLKEDLQKQIKTNSENIKRLTATLSEEENLSGFVIISPDESWDFCQ